MSMTVGFNPQCSTAQRNYGVNNIGKQQVGFQGNLGTLCSEAGSAIGRQVKLDQNYGAACRQLAGTSYDIKSSKILRVLKQGATVIKDTLSPEVLLGTDIGGIPTGNKIRALTVQKGEGLLNRIFNRVTIEAKHLDVV